MKELQRERDDKEEMYTIKEKRTETGLKRSNILSLPQTRNIKKQEHEKKRKIFVNVNLARETQRRNSRQNIAFSFLIDMLKH